MIKVEDRRILEHHRPILAIFTVGESRGVMKVGVYHIRRQTLKTVEIAAVAPASKPPRDSVNSPVLVECTVIDYATVDAVGTIGRAVDHPVGLLRGNLVGKPRLVINRGSTDKPPAVARDN